MTRMTLTSMREVYMGRVVSLFSPFVVSRCQRGRSSSILGYRDLHGLGTSIDFDLLLGLCPLYLNFVELFGFLVGEL